MTEDVLTDCEMQVLAGYAEGLTKAEVGRWLHLSENTIKKHLERIARRLNARNVKHAVAIGIGSKMLHGIAVPTPVRHAGRAANGCQQPTPVDVGERYPSTTWGVTEWFEMLLLDEQLFNSILRGIGRAPINRDTLR